MKNPASHAHAYRADIDGLRALAILWVVVFHVFPKLWPGGYIGVDVFFVISGFLITSILLREHAAGDFSFMAFYARRLRRIVPAVALVMLAIWALGWLALLSGEYKNLAKHMISGATFTSNFRLYYEVGYFDTAAELKPFMHLWSLSIEEQFYLLWPVILAFAVRWRWSVPWALGVLAVLSFACNIWAVGKNPDFAFFMIYTRFWELSVGCGLAYWESRRKPELTPLAASLLSVLALLVLLWAGYFVDRSHHFPGWWALLPTLATAALLEAGPQAWVNRTLLASRPAVALGMISYPLYLWHWPLLSIARLSEGQPLPPALGIGIILVAALLSVVTYRFVEKPIRFSFFRGNNRALVTAGLAALLLVGATGWVTREKDGFPGRYPNLEEFAGEEHDLIDCHGPYQQSMHFCEHRGANPHLAILGDSRGLSVFRGMTTTGVDQILLIADGSCPYLTEVGVDYNPQCVQSVRKMTEFLRQDHNISTVVLLARGARYLSEDFSRDGSAELDPALKAWHLLPVRPEERALSQADLFFAGYDRTLTYLESLGKQAVLFLEWPEIGFDPTLCSEGRPLHIFPRQVKRPCVVSASDVRSRQAESRAVIARLAKAHPHLKLYDPLPLLCDQNECRALDGEKLLFEDASGHLNIEGGRLVARAFTAWLQAQGIPIDHR